MFKDNVAFSGFSIKDVEQTRTFYSETLGLDVRDLPGMEEFGMLQLYIKGSTPILMYQKTDHQPATFTVLSIIVDNIDVVVKQLNDKGIEMIKYGWSDMPQDELGIARGLSVNQGPDIAWFTDPSGNNLAVLQES